MSIDTKERYGLITRVFHWGMAVLIVWQFLKFFDRINDGEHWVGETLVQWHGSIGIVLLLLVVLRMVWAWLQSNNRPEHHPSRRCRTGKNWPPRPLSDHFSVAHHGHLLRIGPRLQCEGVWCRIDCRERYGHALDAGSGHPAFTACMVAAASGDWAHHDGPSALLCQKRRGAAAHALIFSAFYASSSKSGPISASVAHPHRAIATSSSVRKM